MFTRKIWIWIVFILFEVIVIVSIGVLQGQSQDSITIALAVPLSNAGEATEEAGKSMLRGTQLYINEVNNAGGIDGKSLKLEVYDDHGKVEVAEEIAKKIVKSNAIAVIGHYSSSTSKAAGKIYQAAGIPAISGSATADSVTLDNDWYFRTIFADSYQGKFIANYLKQILKYSKIALIHGYDAYGLGLGQAIEAEFKKLGGEIISKWQLPENQSPVTDNLIIQELKKLKDNGKSPQALVLATNRDQVINLLVQMKRENLNFPLFGGDDLGDKAIAKVFENFPEERENKGFFTRNLSATVPLVYDVANDRTQEFRRKIQDLYQDTPGWSAATYYDATVLVVEAINRTLLAQKDSQTPPFTGKNIKQDRYLIREALLKINSPETAVQGTKTFYFNSRRNAVVPIAVGRFYKGNLVSDFIQLQAISDLKSVRNFQEEIAKEKIVNIGERFFYKTNIVYAGIDLNKISDLDEKSSTYLVDFYLWFRYQGDVDVDQIEFINYGIARLDSGEKLTLDEPINVKKNQSANLNVYRVKADFHEEFDFHDYPFDNQSLFIKFRHSNLTRDKLIYAIDLIGMRDSSVNKISKQWQEQVFDEISSWLPEKLSFYQDTLINESTLGDQDAIETNSKLEYSQFNVKIDIKRDLIRFSIKNLLPLWFFVAIAYGLLFLPFENISAELLSGLLLAIVFFHLSLLDALPDGIGYVVALDYAFYLVYLLIALELIFVILGNNNSFQSSETNLAELIKFSRISFPLISLIGSLLLYWQYS
ncbi:MAG TPA: hypothetical protein DEG17_26040 [Cyanobacteria bacterium UBA11149]|nr:hypothetical protein [Cyanobacteria bacterium UBA11367]HBE58894.1 hypothetical protein [Cyanobacteria bacterium UBA11366]HBK65421.1 hypothetical protein [Cyanobacteria bacterium UBA11166]HBR73538.1 hypothetical protein [Cyanobacteria bacterium UBA11159]HBS69580.1 hypothetical protein [Cyanobacteria bacterium UBA11153]HBW92232.1 hypothetical protein [Cyanobacteria bacterium UBA11149]